jgi:hypothetical protein
MSKNYFTARHNCAAFGALVAFALLVPTCVAQFKITDNFNRADGAVGLGWTAWGMGAQISSNQLETFGETNVAGGIERTLDVTFPLQFAFDFRTDSPSDGGWLIGFNALNTNQPTGDSSTVEGALVQFAGSREICTAYQTLIGPAFQCFGPVSGQRDFTATAHITGLMRPDFSAVVMIKYNDGQMPPSVTLRLPAPAGALQQPVGSIFFFGNSNASLGPHFFDNFQLSLM